MNDVGQTLHYPFAELPAEGSAIEVADGILWLSTPLPFAGLRQVNLWLLRDGDGWTMVDCGFGSDAVRQVLTDAWAVALAGRPITRLVITHFHPDHAGNAGWMAERWGLTPLMTQGEWFAATIAMRDGYEDAVVHRAAFFRAHGLAGPRLETFLAGVTLYSACARLPGEYRRVRDGDVIEIGGDHWIIVTGEGHSPEHAALYCPARGIVISGDQILPTITTNVSAWHSEPEGDPLALFLATCRRLGAMLDPTCLVLPSHRRPFRNVRHRLDELIHHHAERLDLITAAAGTGEVTAADLIDVLFQRKLDGHQMGFAMGEAIAHLNHLVTLGRMERRRDAAGIYRFKRLG